VSPTSEPPVGPTSTTAVEVNAEADQRLITAIDEAFASIDPSGPGCTVAVGRRGVVTWSQGYGMADIEAGEAMDTASIVDIGSTSKQFTGTAILLLAGRGEIDLDAPVSNYLDGLPAWADTVTVDHLVHHESGITDYIGLLLEAGIDFIDVATVEQAYDALRSAAELAFEPGSSFQYSNSNYFLLSLIVEQVAGVDLGTFLAAEVFGPLGLDAVMDPTASLAAKAQSYRAGPDGTWVDADSPWQQLGDGAVQTTPSELVRWSLEYLEPSLGGSRAEAEVLNDRRLAGAVEAAEVGGRYGFGILATVENGNRYLSHSGGWGGFITLFTLNVDTGAAVAATCTAAEVVPASFLNGVSLDGVIV
jgi:CubicO group peptidase (beta-lactamase class C family)